MAILCIPKPQISTFYILQILKYSLDKILMFKVTTASSKVNQGHTIILNTYNPMQCPNQVLTSYTLQFLRYNPDKNLSVKVTMARSKVKSSSNHDITQLQPLNNVPTKYQLPTPYSF